MNDEQREELIKSFKEHKYERSRHLMDFHVAGFAYYDGLDVIEELTLGKNVDLVPESDNPYDPEAVVIFYNDRKIGHVLKDKNELLSKLLYFDHADILNGSIILLHDIYEASVEATKLILEYLQAEGYKFVIISEL